LQLATAAGQAFYPIPASVVPFIRATSVRIGADRRALEHRTNSEIASISTVGQPLYWTYWDNALRLGPVPTGVETIFFDAYGGPAPALEVTPASVVDEILFSPDAEDAVVYGSSSSLCAITNESSRAADYAALYKSKIDIIRARLSPSADAYSNRDQVRDAFRGDNNFF